MYFFDKIEEIFDVKAGQMFWLICQNICPAGIRYKVEISLPFL